MQKIKDELYAIHDLCGAAHLALEQLNITEAECVNTVVKEAQRRTSDLIELVDEMDLHIHKEKGKEKRK